MPIRVLIADDHELFRDGIRNLLEQDAGIEVAGEAVDGEQAVELAKSLRPDVVLMDVAMPRVNGVEATRQIKEQCPEVAVLVLTAFDDDSYLFALLQAGVAGYLLKNAPSGEVRAAIHAVYCGESVLSQSVVRKVLAKFRDADEPRGFSEDQRLTGRESEIMRLAAMGLTNKAIAKRLSVSPRTIQQHLGHIFVKLGVASRTEAVVMGLKRGWLHLEELE